MSMLYNKIRFEIDLNSGELLKIIWEHMREIKKESWKDIIKLINLHLLIIILIFEEQGNHVIPKNHSCHLLDSSNDAWYMDFRISMHLSCKHEWFKNLKKSQLWDLILILEIIQFKR